MTNPFLSSEEFDERAHALYNEGKFDEAVAVLREGLGLYPNAVELHVGMGYAHLAREEYAWARRSFDAALLLDQEHEDALAGLGEVLLKFGQVDAALARFEQTVTLGFQDDIELMLQIGRTLFREGLIEEARRFFDIASAESPDNAEAMACIGYVLHRMGDDDGAIAALRRTLQLDGDHVEARIYLGNLLYDRGEPENALYHLDRSTPADHWDELGIWRLMELKKSIYRLPENDPELEPWVARLAELQGTPDAIDELLAELEGDAEEPQLELFGTSGPEFNAGAPDPLRPPPPRSEPGRHRVVTTDGQTLDGTWEEIVGQLRDASGEYRDASVTDFMTAESRRQFGKTGVRISSRDAESFIRGSAAAGLLRILK